jgi:dTDP-4-amino-4,6-dideoxygalactose transaminase
VTVSFPFNRPQVSERGRKYVLEALASGHHSGDGTFTRQCHDLLQRELGVGKVLLTTSCTAALEMCALLLNIQHGDEVIIPAFTFVSTANAFVLRGATIVFADVRPDTLNLDERIVPSLVTPRTRAIVPVHYAGIGCEMDALTETARQTGIALVEDNAHGLFGRYRGRLLGTFGPLATQSFHETKNFSCGEGGALLINDAGYAERAEILREKGTNRSRFFRGEIEKYGWVDVGSSYLPADVLAAQLLAQLEERVAIQERRAECWGRYDQRLRDWARAHGVGQPTVPLHVHSAHHLYFLLLPSLADRQALIAHLKHLGLHALFHYLPLHLSPMGKRFGGRPGLCPVTEDASDRLLRLPLFNGMTDEEQDRVIEAVLNFRGWHS